jgi:hypothetical protein
MSKDPSSFNERGNYKTPSLKREWELFASKSNDRVLFGGARSRDKASKGRKKSASRQNDEGDEDWKIGNHADSVYRANRDVKEELEQISDGKTEETTTDADDKCFGVEEMGNVFLSSA